MSASLPYLASNKNIGELFAKMASAAIPPKFTQEYLQKTIGLKGTNDRPLIPLLRNLGFLDQSNTPTSAYSLLKAKDKSGAATLPQLLKVIEHTWKQGFDDLVRDRGLIHEARLLVHLRNTICHMSAISIEETERIRQTMRDWFRVVAP